MNVLVINAGSSSLKYQLVEMDKQTVLAKGICERIGANGSVLTHKAGADKFIQEYPMKDHHDAIEIVLQALTDPRHGVIGDIHEIAAAGHRVVHGGESFSGSMIINGDVVKALEVNSELAPLHNPANIIGIKACQKALPNAPMVAVFDTAFHQSMPAKAYMYGIGYDSYEKHRIRRYGFHGTSHLYVSRRAAELLDKPYEECKIITCHLGNGSSITAVDHGKSVDTSMGFTPLAGVVMGTRSGDIDPSIIEFLMHKEGWNIHETMNYLNKQSGMLGLSGVSSDFRDCWVAADEGNERAKLALDVFCYSVKKYIGAYAAVMNGVDCVVFTAGVGENDYGVREAVMKDMEYLGVDFDYELNHGLKGRETELTKQGSKVKVYLIPTDEEMVIARDTAELIK